MTGVLNTDPPVVSAEDEGRHPAGSERLWNESWYFDVADPTRECGAYLRFGLYPNRSQTWLHVVLAGRDRPLTLLSDDTAPAAAVGKLEMQTPRWATRLEPVSALDVFRVTTRAAAEQFDDPRAVFRRERGRTTDLELDLTWTSIASPYHYGLTTRYEVSAGVTGTIRVGDEVIPVDAPGQRDHSWGVRDWWAFGWCWSAGSLEDGTAFHLSDIRMGTGATGFGYVISPEGRLAPATEISASEDLDAEAVPLRASLAVEPGNLRMTVEPVALGPIVFEDDDGRIARMPRLLCRYITDDGRIGSGWTEWNMPMAAPPSD